MVEFLYSFYLLINIVRLNFARQNNLLENLNDRLLNAIPNASRSTTQRKP